MEEKFILNELRNLILLKTGIRTISPADCKRISDEITKELNRTVSETTIKRLFGFAKANHKFSRFTLTTLLEYVEKEDLIRSLPKHPLLLQNGHTGEWTIARDAARRITELTVKSIKHRSGLPYHMTIDRNFAENDFEDFYHSDYSFMSFISQPGYGRSILLSRLADKYFLKTHPSYHNCISLFINITNLFNHDYKTFDLEEHLKYQLNINSLESIISFVDKHYELTEGKLIIFLDGFTDFLLRRDLKFQIFESIINFITTLDETDSIKLILNMRSTTWSRFYEHIRHSSHLRSKWFPGNYFNTKDLSNVPLLTEKEVDQILFNINGVDSTTINARLKAQLKFPYHFQLYYQLKDEDPNFDHSSNTSSFELITKLIQEKIYRSNYYTEKIVFLKKLIQLTGNAKKGISVAKDDLINELSAFKNAYMELISGGILIEEKHTLNAHPKEYVRFIQAHMFEYFLFIELLEKHHLKLDDVFFKHVAKEYAGSNLALSLLKWSVRFVIRMGDFKVVNIIFDIKLSHEQKNHLILFAVENLKYRQPFSVETLTLLHRCRFHHNVIKHLLHSNLLDKSHQKSITLLLQIVDTNENKVFYHSLLSIIASLCLDVNSLGLRLIQMESFKESASSWFINPYDVVWLLNQKLNNIHLSEHPVLEKLELFKQDHTILNVGNLKLGNQELLTYMFMFTLNVFYGNSAEQIRIIRSILNIHPGLFHKRSAFSTYILSLLAVACAQTSPGEKTEQMESILGKLYENGDEELFTDNTSTIYQILRAEQDKNRGNYEQALKQAVDCLHFYMQTGLDSICLMLYNLIIKICTGKRDFEKANEFKYEKYTFMEERNLPKHLFPLPENTHINP